VSAIDISRDGQFVMLVSRDEKTRSRETLIVPIRGGEPIRHLSRGDLRHWTPDGRGLAYVDSSASNVWVQPLDGGAPHQVTHLTDGPRIVEFAWSPDGKQLALTRAIETTDIVMLKGIR
jgi:Tol biopolymer transport system component